MHAGRASAVSLCSHQLQGPALLHGPGLPGALCHWSYSLFWPGATRHHHPSTWLWTRSLQALPQSSCISISLTTDLLCVCVHLLSHVQLFVDASSLPGSSVHGIFFPGKNTGVGCHFSPQGIFLTQGSNPGFLHLLHWQADSLLLSHLGSPNKKSVMVFCSLPGLRGQEQHREGIWQGSWMWANWPASFISPVTYICMQPSIIQIQVWGGKYFLVFWGSCPRSHSQGLDGMTLEASSLLLWSRDSFKLSSFLKFPEREESTNPKEYKSPWH